jgi:hypothetical protein
MKKIIFLSLLLFVFKAEAQESVTFKMAYAPNHNYNGTVNMDMNCNVTLKGDTQITNKLKAQGMTQPLVLSMGMKMNGNIKTGSPGTDGVFPLVMNYKMGQLNINIGGKAIPMPAQVSSDMNIYGHVGADGKLKADSISGNKMKDTAQKKISQMMNTFQNMVKFPDHPMHIGDTFTQDMPFNIPMAGNNMATNAKAVYKLVSIADGNAYFDVAQSMNVTVPIKGQSITLTGAGTGKLVYDLKSSFPTDYKSSVNLKFNGQIAALTIDGSAVMNMEYKYVIN